MTTFSATRFASGAAIVAGGSGGLGAAICRTLAEAGSDVALTYHRNKAGADAAAASVRAARRKAEIAEVDLTGEEAVRAFVAQSEERFGGIHTVIYSAGPFIQMRHVSKLEPKVFRETVSTDLFGFYNVVHAALPALRKTQGAIVALATTAIRRATAKDVMSSAPKAAVEAVVKTIASEEGRFGIRANCIGVGVIDDGMFPKLIERGEVDSKFIEATKAGLALRRLGTAQNIADAVAFLASDRASFITGQSLMVDGGYAI